MKVSERHEALQSPELDSSGFSFNPLDYYAVSISAGVRVLLNPGNRLEGAKRIINPVSYSRFAEYEAAVHRFAPHITSGDVLDIGSPKLPAVVLAKNLPGLRITSTDIDSKFIPAWRQVFSAVGLGNRLGKDLKLESQDARQLKIPNASQDWVYSISVVEHVADQDGIAGDSQAMKEIARVMRPGATATLTMPFDENEYWEEYVTGSVYERRVEDREPNFYQRHYNANQLQNRIIVPSGLILEDVVYLGEPYAEIEKYWNRIPMKLKAPLLPLQGMAGYHLFKEVSDLRKARGVALKLRKPNTTDQQIAA